ncbi:MAG: GNAT family N-acetyltransferase [Hyphomicrobiales bacterium]|nr:GNAT family N-acetyltransferase [Hyphomicrobiales bacterium]
METVSVSIDRPALDLVAPWSALIERAAPNVFMHPAALHTAHTTGMADIRTLAAWANDAQSKRLVGLWALQRTAIMPLWPTFLAAPAYGYAFVSDPVIDPQFLDETVAAFLAAIENDRSLPKVVRLRYLDGGSINSALMRALGARGAQTLQLAERQRPYVTCEAGVKRSGSTRKKLRQDWNRLSTLGTVEIANARSVPAVREAFDIFLTMEAASWKGSRGTALLCDPADAAFVRRLIANLATGGNASVALLSVNGRTIAAQVLLYCSHTAYTWKTAFDSGFGKYSPGALLVDKVTEQLFAQGIEAIESCSPEGGFMNQIWDGRRATVDLLIDLGARKSLEFRALVASERGTAQLRGWRNRLRRMPAVFESWRKRAAAIR